MNYLDFVVKVSKVKAMNRPDVVQTQNGSRSALTASSRVLRKRGYVTFRSLLSQIRLSSVMFVRPTQGVETCGNIFFAILYHSHPLTSLQNFTEIVPGEPLRRAVKRKRGSKMSHSDSGISSPDEFLV